MTMNDMTKLKLRDIFGTSEYDIGIARLLIVARQATAIFQALTYLPAGSAHRFEYQTVLVGLYLSLLKELVDALDFLRSKGIIERLTSDKNNLTDIRNDAITAMSFLNKKDPSSLYSRLLDRVRNNAGFHIINTPLKTAIEELQDISIQPYIEAGEPKIVASIPLVSALLAQMAFKQPEELPQLLKDASTLQDAASRVALDLYLINVRIAEAKK